MKIILRISFFFVLSTYCWSQTNDKVLVVTYVKAYKNFKDSTDTNPKILKNVEYRLNCNINEGRFEFIHSMDNDGQTTNKRFISRGGGDGIYYKNINEKIKLHQLNSPIDEKVNLIKIPFNEYEWTLTNEKKVINGYVCYKAYTEQEYEAPDKTGTKLEKVKYKTIVWFTPEINYPFGPAGFDGLPGLVLEKYSSSFYFIATKIVFLEKEKGNSLVRPKEGIQISKSDYDKRIREEYKKFLIDN